MADSGPYHPTSTMGRLVATARAYQRAGGKVAHVYLAGWDTTTFAMAVARDLGEACPGLAVVVHDRRDVAVAGYVPAVTG